MSGEGDIDLTVPSIRAAYAIARQTAETRGKEEASALMARLLFHVEFDYGGFLGASDCDEIRIASIRRRFGITVDQYLDALWNPAPWPCAEAVAAVAA